MTAMQIFDFLAFDFAPVGLAFVVILMIYLVVTEARTAHRRAKREREQQVH